MSIASLSAQPSPSERWVGVCIDSFEACSGFTHVTARWIARPPGAVFVTRLRPGQLPNQAAIQTFRWIPPPLVIRAFEASSRLPTGRWTPRIRRLTYTQKLPPTRTDEGQVNSYYSRYAHSATDNARIEFTIVRLNTASKVGQHIGQEWFHAPR